MIQNQELFNELYSFNDSDKRNKTLIVSKGEDERAGRIIYEHDWPIKIIKNKARRDGTVKLVLEKS